MLDEIDTCGRNAKTATKHSGNTTGTAQQQPPRLEWQQLKRLKKKQKAMAASEKRCQFLPHLSVKGKSNPKKRQIQGNVSLEINPYVTVCWLFKYSILLYLVQLHIQEFFFLVRIVQIKVRSQVFLFLCTVWNHHPLCSSSWILDWKLDSVSQLTSLSFAHKSKCSKIWAFFLDSLGMLPTM